MKDSNTIHHGYHAGHLIAALVTGAVTGAGIAYLTAPKSGSDMRHRIRDVAHDAGHTAHNVPDAIRKASAAARQAFVDAMALEEGQLVVTATSKPAARQDNGRP